MNYSKLIDVNLSQENFVKLVLNIIFPKHQKSNYYGLSWARNGNLYEPAIPFISRHPCNLVKRNNNIIEENELWVPCIKFGNKIAISSQLRKQIEEKHISITSDIIEVSNFGRIGIKITMPFCQKETHSIPHCCICKKICHYILPQYEYIELTKNKEEFQHPNGGYLAVNNGHNTYYIYRLISESFYNFTKENEQIIQNTPLDNLDCHHIDNDGYNNNINNLIFIPKKEHQLIHKEVQKFELYNNGKNVTRKNAYLYFQKIFDM